MTSTTFKELKDGRYRLKLTYDILHILLGALVKRAQSPGLPAYEQCLLHETMQALQKEEIRLRKSEFFLLFSRKVQIHVEEETQQFINAWLKLDEVKRQALEPAKRFSPVSLSSFQPFKS